MSINNNLFYYATSELSQDAIICYIMSFAMEGNKNVNREIYNITLELINLMGINDEEITVTGITKQYENIDVLVEINEKYNIIIEDKTFTSLHSDQINRYKQALVDKNKENIICVYYKIVEEYFTEKDVINITRNDILNILMKYNTGDKIIEDYTNYLKWIDKDVNSYKFEPIHDWKSNAYRGFFTYLVNERVIDSNRLGGWSYINNPSGGLWGLWWYYIDCKSMESSGLYKEYIKDLYLQISNNQITVKISKPENISPENLEILKDIRWSLYNYFKSNLPDNLFSKSKFKQGKYMSVGFIEYNEKNYKEKLELMESVMKNIEGGKYNYSKVGE